MTPYNTSVSGESFRRRPRFTKPTRIFAGSVVQKTAPSASSANPTHIKTPPRTHRTSEKPRTSRFSRSNLPHRAPIEKKKPDAIVPPIGDAIRIIPLGGVEEIGRNMTAVEYGNDIIVIDMGFQFREEDTPGVDYILPNTKYLEERKDKIRAVIITHGHLDHIGGIPYLMPRIGNPPLYSRALTTIMIKKRQEEFPHVPALNIVEVEKDEIIRLGELRVRFFAVTHTIPDSMGIIIDTPYGSIVTPGDIKLDHNDSIPTDAEQKEYARFEKEKVLFLMMDSTNVDNPGFSTPERLVHKNLEEIIKNIKGRLIIGTFASQIERMLAIIDATERCGKKIVVEGRSMKGNIDIVRAVGRLKAKKETIITVEEMDSYPPDKIVVLATGAQGDEFAALMRMANKTHKQMKISKRDTILLSSSVIPGNERAVQKLKDNLARQGAKIIHYRSSDVYIHSTGHGNRGELEWLHRHFKPKFFMPVHGSHYMLRVHAELAKQIGMPEENIVVPDNGTIVEIREKGTKMVALKEKAPSSSMVVDGFFIGDIQEAVIRDRKTLAEDGIVVIIASINLKTGKLKKSPDIISRGFVYLRESQELLQQTRIITKKSIEDSTHGMNPINFDFVKSNVSDAISRFLFQKTAKKPLVISVVLGV